MSEGKEIVDRITRKITERLCTITSDLYELRVQISRLENERDKLEKLRGVIEKDPDTVAVITSALNEAAYHEEESQ